MKHIKIFEEYSVYSMAARVADPKFSKPVYNNDYKVEFVKITFPDTTELIFRVIREDYFSDKVNYTISVPDMTRSGSPFFGLNSPQSYYLKVFGNSIQMENYEEYVFVRCWNNPQDFLENEWEGYISRSDVDKGFNEISMKFISSVYIDASPDAYYKSSFGDRNVMMNILDNYNKELPNGISYSNLMTMKRKFESYLIDLDETKTIDLLNCKLPYVHDKSDNLSLISTIYAMGLKDTSIFKNFKISTTTLRRCPVSRLLDTIF